MSSSDEFAQSLRVAQSALTLLTRNQVPATPPNYLVWFTYAEGSNAELRDFINSHLKSGTRITDAIMAEAQDKYLPPAEERAEIHEVGEKLSVELKRISDTLSHSGASTAAYGQALSKISGKLGQTDDVAALKTMVSGLVSATKVMESQSRQLEDRLKQSNAEVQQLQQQLSKINKEALTDALTGLANRRCFDITLKNAVLEAIEKKESLCLIMCDIDHFKRFNDTWGHQMGDQVLRLVARCLSDNVKGRDTAARYGGEEFAVILPATTPENARNLGEQIRRSVENKKIIVRSTNESLGTVALSLGCAALRPDENWEDLIERADACLYAAKRGGRNRVVSDIDPDAAEARTDVDVRIAASG